MDYIPGGYPPPYSGYAVYPPDPYREPVRYLRKRSNALGWVLCSFFLATFVFSAILSIAVSVIGVTYQDQYAAFSGMSPELYYWMTGVLYILSLFVPFLIFGAAVREPLSEQLTFGRIQPLDFIFCILFGFGACMAANIPTNVIVAFLQALGFSGEMPSYPETETLGANIIYAVLIAVLAPFFEEFVFRGIVLGRLRRFGNGVAIFGSALLFGLFHGNFIQMPFAFLCGLVLGYIVVRTGSLWAAVAVHFLNNGFAVFQEFCGKYGSEQLYFTVAAYVPLIVIALGLAAGLCLLITYRKHTVPNVPEAQIPLSRRLGAFFISPGMILFIILSLAESVAALIEMG